MRAPGSPKRRAPPGAATDTRWRVASTLSFGAASWCGAGSEREVSKAPPEDDAVPARYAAADGAVAVKASSAARNTTIRRTFTAGRLAADCFGSATGLGLYAMLTDRMGGRELVQTSCERGIHDSRRRRVRNQAFPAALAVIAGVALLVSACSPTAWVDETALPNPGAKPIGVSYDASLTDPADLPTFDDGNGHGEVPPGGAYQLGVRQGQSVVTATLDAKFPADQIVTAGFETTGSPPDAGFGVVCRMVDEDNYYRLGVANDGQYAIQRVKDGTSTVLTGEPSRLDPKDGSWTIDPELRDTPGPFTVRAECAGNTLTLFESNREVISTRDSTITGTNVGVFVESFAEPDSTLKVQSLSVRAFRDHRTITEAASARWDGLLRAQNVAKTCALLDPVAAGIAARGATVTRCGSVLFIQPETPERGVRAYSHILDDSGATLDTVKGLPNCAKRTGVRGSLPPPTPPAGTTDSRATIGRVACLDLSGSTAVVWVHEPSGVVGVTRVKDRDRAAWKGYGSDWTPFAYEEQPG